VWCVSMGMLGFGCLLRLFISVVCFSFGLMGLLVEVSWMRKLMVSCV